MFDRTANDDTHDTVWDLLPWFVNGTLEAEEKRQVEHHLESCAACREELASQRRLVDAVANIETVDISEQRHWDRIHRRIRDERNEQSVSNQRTDGFVDRALHALRRLWFVPAIAAACVAFLAVVQPLELGDEAEFRTLTNTAPAVGPLLRIKVADGVGPERLAAILADMDVEIVEGPSPTGVYSARSTGVQPLEDVAATLGSHEEIEFSSVRPAP